MNAALAVSHACPLKTQMPTKLLSFCLFEQTILWTLSEAYTSTGMFNKQIPSGDNFFSHLH